MFLSRIREAAGRQQVLVKAVRTVPDLLESARAARIVLVDLDSRRLPVLEALAALRADSALASLPVVGFFSHVDVARARETRAAGCTTVLPRSAFVQQIDALLRDPPSGDGSGKGGEPEPGA